MTTWCYLHIEAKGDPESLDKIEKDGVDFEKLLPIPKMLERTVNVSESEIDKMDLESKFGYRSWWDWSAENWGTKWNFLGLTAYNGDTEKEGGGGDTMKRILKTVLHIRGKVPWGIPYPPLMELSVRNPKVAFEIEAMFESSSAVETLIIINGVISNEKKMDVDADQWLDYRMDGCI